MTVYDPWDESVIQDPFPHFKRLRDAHPVYHHIDEDLWFLSRYKDVEESLFDWRRFSSSQGNMVREDPMRIGKTMTTNDPPRHDELRRLIQLGYTPGRVAMQEERIHQLTKERISQIDLDDFDFINEFSGPLTGLILGTLIGVPDEDLEMLRIKVDEGLAFTRENPTGKGLGEVFDYMLGLIASRRANPGDDMISAFCTADAGDDFEITDLEIAVLCGSILGAGFSSAAHHMGNVMLSLYDWPAIRAAVIEDTSLVPSMVEESMRFDVSTMAFARQTTCEVEIEGVTIPENARVVCLLSSANRDERVFDEPDKFLLDRKKNRHMGFSHGVHYCLGAALARSQMKIAFESLLPLLGTYDIDFDASERLQHLNFRGFRKLRIRR